jgi:hypothetical protein
LGEAALGVVLGDAFLGGDGVTGAGATSSIGSSCAAAALAARFAARGEGVAASAFRFVPPGLRFARARAALAFAAANSAALFARAAGSDGVACADEDDVGAASAAAAAEEEEDTVDVVADLVPSLTRCCSDSMYALISA